MWPATVTTIFKPTFPFPAVNFLCRLHIGRDLPAYLYFQKVTTRVELKENNQFLNLVGLGGI